MDSTTCWQGSEANGTLSRRIKWYSHIGKSFGSCGKIKQTPTLYQAVPIPDIYPREMKHVHKKKTSQSFIATLCKTAKPKNSPGVHHDENGLTNCHTVIEWNIIHH